MRRITVSDIRPADAEAGEWIDISGHVGRLMSTLMADGRPLSIGITPDGMTVVTPLAAISAETLDTKTAAGDDADAEEPKASNGEGRITSRTTLYDRFRARLKENLDERKQ